jgi:hypothetical protein
MDQNTGKWIVVAGVAVTIIGVVIYFLHDKLNWIGRLPGDIRVERENFRFYFPITTMILFSALLTAVVNIVRRFC